MSFKDENSIFKLIPRLGRRAGHGSNTHEEKNEDDLPDSPESLPSGKSMAKKSAPPRARKTGWGDELKFSKDRATTSANSKDDDIPSIPDLDDIIEDTSGLNISDTPASGVNPAAEAYKELDKDLLKNKLFSKYDDVDLSILIDQLYPEHLVQEPDEVWTWDSLFTQLSSEMNSEAQSKSKDKQRVNEI